MCVRVRARAFVRACGRACGRSCACACAGVRAGVCVCVCVCVRACVLDPALRVAWITRARARTHTHTHTGTLDEGALPSPAAHGHTIAELADFTVEARPLFDHVPSDRVLH